MAAELKQSLDVDATLIPGAGGIFEVKRDGRMVYNKAEIGRFPKPGEVTAILNDAR